MSHPSRGPAGQRPDGKMPASRPRGPRGSLTRMAASCSLLPPRGFSSARSLQTSPGGAPASVTARRTPSCGHVSTYRLNRPDRACGSASVPLTPSARLSVISRGRVGRDAWGVAESEGPHPWNTLCLVGCSPRLCQPTRFQQQQGACAPLLATRRVHPPARVTFVMGVAGQPPREESPHGTCGDERGVTVTLSDDDRVPAETLRDGPFLHFLLLPLKSRGEDPRVP